MKTESHDVVIIGAGAGGGACAWALATRGVKVLVLDAGPRFDPEKDYNLENPNWEQASFPKKKNSEGRYTFGDMQKLDKKWQHLSSWNAKHGVLNASDQRLGWRYHHVRGIGGSTLHFTGEAHRLNPKAMQLKSMFDVAADWPISYNELEPFYEIAEKIIGVSGPAVDRIRPRKNQHLLPPHPKSYASQQIEKALNMLELNWDANSLAILSKPYNNRPACNYCGNCTRGCPRNDKGSVDVTFIRQAINTGRCEVRSECTVTSLEIGKKDQISGLTYIDSKGVSNKISARNVVVACGAIETPRLLLSAKSNKAPDGIANESGLVGKNFMETTSWVSSGLHPKSLGSHRGLPSDSICWDFNMPNAIPDVIGGCRFTLGMAEVGLLGPINYAHRVVDGWGLKHKKTMRENFGRALSLGSVGESLPNENSFIDLDPHKTDEYGLPIARINTYLDEMEIKRLDFMAAKTREILNTAGVDEFFEEFGTYDTFSSTHVFGTCRMGTNIENSVVDANCRSHRWKNLFIIDASVFPSSGGGESPSLTIEAIAIKAGFYLSNLMLKKEV